jgi:hypothetical protein
MRLGRCGETLEAAQVVQGVVQAHRRIEAGKIHVEVPHVRSQAERKRAISGVARSRSRHRARVGPMLPIRIPVASAISR